jgi:hypothetical protein
MNNKPVRQFIRGATLAVAIVLLTAIQSAEATEPATALTSSPIPTDSSGFQCGVLTVYNSGAIGLQDGNDLRWDCDSILETDPIYQGSFVIAGDSSQQEVMFRSTLAHNSMFVANEPPGSAPGGFRHQRDTLLGYWRDGSCPGTRQAIQGNLVTVGYSDTLVIAAEVGWPASAGLVVTQTNVSSKQEPYGDFILLHYDVENRNDVAVGPLYAGTFIDWDIGPGIPNNDGRYSDNLDGYFLWNPLSPTMAFGVLDPNQPSRYSGVDPSANPPYRIGVYLRSSFYSPFFTTCFGCPTREFLIQSWREVVSFQPLRELEYPGHADDRCGMLINPPFSLLPHGSASVDQAMFWVDATSNDPAVMESNAVGVAHRAARWAGFARGDVNDDGFVDLADVCWLKASLPIYPDQYCGDVDVDGDVDAADTAYLLNYVSGLGPAPRSAWRFKLPPTP